MGVLIAIIVVAAVAVIAAVTWYLVRKKRTEGLQQRFGPEYERAMSRTGDRKDAESELEARRDRVAQLNIHPLDPAQKGRFTSRWREVQGRFVDDPTAALVEAERLVVEAMEACVGENAARLEKLKYFKSPPSCA